jgi:hypothetical protein
MDRRTVWVVSGILGPSWPGIGMAGWVGVPATIGYNPAFDAGLAQLVVHLICNQGVGGSNPSAGTNSTSIC